MSILYFSVYQMTIVLYCIKMGHRGSRLSHKIGTVSSIDKKVHVEVFHFQLNSTQLNSTSHLGGSQEERGSKSLIVSPIL